LHGAQELFADAAVAEVRALTSIVEDKEADFKKTLDQLKDQYRRLQADFDNFRTRAVRQPVRKCTLCDDIAARTEPALSSHERWADAGVRAEQREAAGRRQRQDGHDRGLAAADRRFRAGCLAGALPRSSWLCRRCEISRRKERGTGGQL